MSESARCPECGWSREAQPEAADKVVAVVSELEGHLAGEHDWTWQRAHEHARAWSKLLIPSLEGASESGKRATRTANCPQCTWTVRAHSEELIEVSHCSSQLEAHLKSAHGMPGEEALAVAEDWALPLLRGQVR